MNTLSKVVAFCLYLSVHLGALILASASQRQPTPYLNSTAVTLSELLKLIASCVAISATEKLGGLALVRALLATLFKHPSQLLKVCIPALLYTVQNNVIYATLGHLDAVSFQISYQMKIVASLLSVRLLLNRKVSPLKWLAVSILTAGVVLVQLSLRPQESQPPAEPTAPQRAGGGAQGSGGAGCSTDPLPTSPLEGAAPAAESVEAVAEQTEINSEQTELKAAGAAGAAGAADAADAAGAADAAEALVKKRRQQRSYVLGILGVLIACMCSGLAGAAMERLLKAGEQTLPRRNMQVAFISFVLACVHMLLVDKSRLLTGGFFQGYNRLVWSMVVLDSTGGLLVSWLLKYTSTMLKNFAAPLGIIINCLIARFFNKSPQPTNGKFKLGTILVLLALCLYTGAPA